ncbi:MULTISPECIES: CRR6 family NdhI maturation factor [Cyanophyceae]|uniref:CRR6 family NdhI maturation factor n=1 Tax=Cyanophyceae TaxID=3028117 RepID=UPI00168272AB|nr:MULTISPECIES: CRR6 family NdhI maturation factor [Cyanophyceae]MBD1917623.1 CRR6 family NdhI maturation factor [Phormidium sp. FACHB-77]MBD2029501.1 CRR6 family NdhI maturation factor [Phormidium sp. FACHB-322]MBD2050762.1 CRR6 family NdhI maturation factor [Leptolyngbya sp. FACHB-60]
MAHTITLHESHLQTLDLTPAWEVIEPLLAEGKVLTGELGLRFVVDINRDPSDPRELSELPEVRLWFIRLDTHYPWLPLVLDWEAGELGRYAAMLVPHQFSPTEGIRYNPEGLEIFMMAKIFVIAAWLKGQGMTQYTRLKFMTQMLGYEIDDGLFELLA